jgi:hypothetical protein
VSASSGQTFSGPSLFSVSDADHDTLTYSFYDATPANGHFVLNGVVQHDGESFTVTGMGKIYIVPVNLQR